MLEPKKSKDIGMKRGRALSNLPLDQQLDLIATGLPILMKSAGDLFDASKSLKDHHRAAAILEGQALEEVAKILILTDIVQCPSKLRSSLIRKMMDRFYTHLARLVYIEAQSWKPTNVTELQAYVDNSRKSHYLEGGFGEYIMPNWELYIRESTLYADIVGDEDGQLSWNEPLSEPSLFNFDSPPAPWQVCTALLDIGAFTRKGLDVVSSIWSQIGFFDDQNRSDADELTYKMLVNLDKVGLIHETADEELLPILYHRWQIPMYAIDFKQIEVSLAELRSEQDRNFWSEFSGY